MTANLASLSPPRARAGDALVLGGAGFAATGNTVTIDGLAAAVGAETTTAIAVVVPAGIRSDRFVPVVVTHASDGSSSTRQWWSKATAAELRAFMLPLQEPGEFEDWGSPSSVEHPEDIEAKDIEALHELLQYLPGDILTTPGDLAARNDNGVGRVTGAAGASIVLDHATTAGASGIAQRTREPGLLTWGRQLSTAAATAMAVNGAATQGAAALGTEQLTPAGGFATVLAVYVDRQGGTRELDRVEVLVDGAVAHDSGAGLGLEADEQYTANLWADLGTLASSARISVRLTADGGTSTIDCLAALMVF